MRYNRFATEPKKKNIPGWSRKEDVQQKYDSGQVAEYERNKQELDQQVQELFDEFIELFTDEKETLKKFIELTPEEEKTSSDELTEDDEYRIFLSGVLSEPPKFKNLTHKDTDSQAVKDKKDQVRKVLSDPSNYDHFRMMQSAMPEESKFKEYYLNSKYRNASLRKRASDNEEIEKFISLINSGGIDDNENKVYKDIYTFSKRDFDDLISDLEYDTSLFDDISTLFNANKKKLNIEDLKKIEKENEDIDKKIDQEVFEETLNNEMEDEDTKQEILSNLHIDENTEKHLQKILKEEEEKSGFREDEVKKENISSDEVPENEEEKIEKWIFKKSVDSDVFNRIKGEKISSYMPMITQEAMASLSSWSMETDDGVEVDIKLALTIKSNKAYQLADPITKKSYDKIYEKGKEALKEAKKPILSRYISEVLPKDLSSYFFGGSSLQEKKDVLTKSNPLPQFFNLIKTFVINKYTTPTNQKVNFARVCYLRTFGTSEEKKWAQSIVDAKLDTTKDNPYTWYEKDYCRLQYKVQEGLALTTYDSILNDLLINNGVSILIEKEQNKEKEKEVQEELKKKIKWITTNILTSDNATITNSTDATVKSYIEDAKKKDPKDYNTLDTWIMNKLQQEEVKEAKYQLRTNKRQVERLIEKLLKGQKLTDLEKDAVFANLEDNLKDDATTKDAIKEKINEGRALTSEEAKYIDPITISPEKPLTTRQVEILKSEVDNNSDKEKVKNLKKNPEAIISNNKKELAEAKKKQTQKKFLTDFEKELLHQDKVVKEKAKADAPLSKLSLFIEKCKKDPKISQFFQKALCANKVKDFDSYQKKVLHEVYSMIANESEEQVVARNKDRIKFLITEATKECNMRDKRQNLHETLAKYKDTDGATLLDFLPNNMIVEVDDTGTISKLFSMYDNKLSDLKDKIDIQENLMDKFELVKKKIYLDLKEEPAGDPETDSESFIIVKRKLLALIAAIALETGLRPAPVKDLSHPETGDEFGGDAGGMSYKKKLKDELSPEGKKQYEKNLIETYGIATLKPEHIKFFNKNLSANLKFYGKRGVENASKLSQPELVKELEKLVGVASGNLTGPKSLFVLPNGKLVNNTDIVVYFESLAHKAGLQRLKITDFRKLKAVSTIHQSLLAQQGYLYKQIAKLKAIETEAAKVKIAELVMETVDKAYKDAQKALSHSSVNETINSYVNPKLLLNFLSSGGVETAIEKALESKTSLKFDPEVFMVQALAYTGVDLESAPDSLDKKDQAILDKTEDNIFKKIITMGKEFLSKFARK